MHRRIFILADHPLSDLLRSDTAPSRLPLPRASHSQTLERPGTSGTSFIRAIAMPTESEPRYGALSAESFIRSGRERVMARQAAQVADHPMAQATDPTSVTGTRIASPSSMQAAVAMPTHRAAMAGVWCCACTAPTRASTMPRRPRANTRRLAATKFPLKHLKSESRAAARMMLTIHPDAKPWPTACWKATAVMNFWLVS